MRIKIINRNYKLFELDVEGNDTIENLRLKIADREGDDPYSFSLIKSGRMLEDDRTLNDYYIGEYSIIEMGYLYILNFEGVIYKKAGLGCYCCGGHGDLFGFISSKTGLPRNVFYLDIGSEKIRDKDFSVKKYYFGVYFFKAEPNKTIKIKYDDKQFLAYRPSPEEIENDDDILYESIAKAYCSSESDFELDKRVERFKEKLMSRYDLESNGESIDLSEIENLTEITLVEYK